MKRSAIGGHANDFTLKTDASLRCQNALECLKSVAEFEFRGHAECYILLSRMARADKRAWRILVVDDEPLVCDSITRMLAGDEQTVVSATSAEAALAALQHARFDLIIVDYQLPGMKGDEFAAAVKSRDPHLSLVMITAYPETLASSHKQLAGVDLVISKPFGLQELREAISKLLGDNRREG